MKHKHWCGWLQRRKLLRCHGATVKMHIIVLPFMFDWLFFYQPLPDGSAPAILLSKHIQTLDRVFSPLKAEIKMDLSFFALQLKIWSDFLDDKKHLVAI